MKIAVAIFFIFSLSFSASAEEGRDYLDCTIKRKAKFKEEKKKKFHINFVINIPRANDIDREKSEFETDKKWISTSLTLNHEGQFTWIIREEGFPLPHPEIRKKLGNFNSKDAFPVEEDLVREIDSTSSIVYSLRCR